MKQPVQGLSIAKQGGCSLSACYQQPGMYGNRDMSEKFAVPLAGGLLAGIAASACCAGPLVLVLLGFSGAWMSNLAALEPYRPVFIGLARIALLVAYRRIYRAGQESACDNACAVRNVNHRYNWLFAGVTLVVLTSITSPYLVLLIYG